MGGRGGGGDVRHITLFTDVVTLFGNPWYPSGEGYAPRATIRSCISLSRVEVVMPG